MTIIKIDNLTITIGTRQIDGYYTAWAGDYDLGVTLGHGRTRVAAASDLLDQMEEYDRQLDGVRMAMIMLEGASW